jgi:hypothetical protein
MPERAGMTDGFESLWERESETHAVDGYGDLLAWDARTECWVNISDPQSSHPEKLDIFLAQLGDA